MLNVLSKTPPKGYMKSFFRTPRRAAVMAVLQDPWKGCFTGLCKDYLSILARLFNDSLKCCCADSQIG